MNERIVFRNVPYFTGLIFYKKASADPIRQEYEAIRRTASSGKQLRHCACRAECKGCHVVKVGEEDANWIRILEDPNLVV